MWENAWKYGWVVSYPKGEDGKLFNQVTCFHYEPWHYRYLGREMAAKIHDSGLTIREYLWTNFTMVDPITGEPIPTATPTPPPSPTPSPSPSPTATPTPTSTPSPTPTPTASTWFGVDPPVVLAGMGLIALASIGFVAWRGLRR
jgi:D-alanyl-D-alanine carboxypeptidase